MSLRRLLYRRRRFRLTDLRGCVALYDADRIGGLADGAAVASVQDRSGNGNTATQATGANQSTYQTAEINGRPCVRHDGANDFFATAAVPTASLTYTLFAVHKTTPDASAQRILANGVTQGYWLGLGATNLRNVVHASVATIAGGAAQDAFEAWVATRGVAVDLWVNGTQVITGTASTPLAPNTRLTIGAESAGANPAVMDWAVLGVWSRPWTVRERKRVERQIARRRYGLVTA